MIALAAVLFSSHRRTPPLAMVASGLLIISPLNLFEPSFQISFAGVAGLMVWVPAWQARLDDKPPWQRVIGVLLMFFDKKCWQPRHTEIQALMHSGGCQKKAVVN